MQNGRICVCFSSPSSMRDIGEIENSINKFLLDFPEYRIASMAAAIGVIGKVICYFEKIDNTPKNETYNLSKNNSMDEQILADGGWRCLCGRINHHYVSTCVCGRHKVDVLLNAKGTS